MEPTKQSKGRKNRRGKSGQFVALPMYVLNSQAYIDLGCTAIALLIEIARQYNGSNNGDLTTTNNILHPRGFNSHGVINNAKGQLLAHGFIQETRKGKRPNVASLYAITWQPLNMMDKYEIGLTAFKKNAFLSYKPP